MHLEGEGKDICRRLGTRICVCAWFQNLFPLIGVDGVNFVPLDDKVCKGDHLIDVILLVLSCNGVCSKAPVDEAVNDSDCVLIIETPEVIALSVVEE